MTEEDIEDGFRRVEEKAKSCWLIDSCTRYLILISFSWRNWSIRPRRCGRRYNEIRDVWGHAITLSVLFQTTALIGKEERSQVKISWIYAQCHFLHTQVLRQLETTKVFTLISVASGVYDRSFRYCRRTSLGQLRCVCVCTDVLEMHVCKFLSPSDRKWRSSVDWCLFSGTM